MSPKPVMQFGGITLIAIAVPLASRTGSVAVFLGAVPGTGNAEATNPSWLPFWFQLTFMRLFAAAVAGLGANFLWICSFSSMRRPLFQH